MTQDAIYKKLKEILQYGQSRTVFNQSMWSAAGVISDRTQEAVKKAKKSAEGDLSAIMTRDDLLKVLSKEAKKGNSQHAKLLSELQGYESKKQDIHIEMIDFSDAPDWYQTKKP